MSHLMLHCEWCGAAAMPRCRQNTAYVNDDLNWVTLCEEHLRENEEYWKDMWEEHWRNVL